MIVDKDIKFSGEEFMELWRSSTELESQYRELKRKYGLLEDYMIKLEYRISKIEQNIELEDESDLDFKPKEDI